MSYRPSDIFYFEFGASNVSGIASNLDSAPNGVFYKNGLDDFTVHVFINAVDVGRYCVSGQIPNYNIPASIGVAISGYMNSNLTKATFNLGALENPVSVTGIVQSNVIYFSGVPVAAANNSGAILTDLRFINNNLATTYNGIAQSGGINWVQLSSTEPTIDNYYQDQTITIIDGIGAGQCGLIASYSGTTRTVYIDHNWYVVPYNNSKYSFIGYNNVNLEYINNKLLDSKVGVNLNTFFQNAGNSTAEIVDNVGTGGGGSITGVVNANVVSINGNPATSYNGIARSGGLDWIQLASTEPVIDNYYSQQYIYLAGGVGVGQWGLIISYSGTTQTAYIDHDWYLSPYNDTKYLLGGYGVTNSVLSAVATTGSQSVTASITGIVQANVVSFSGVPVAAPNSSGAIISDMRYVQGQLSTLYDGIAQNGSSNTIILANKEPDVDQYYQWCYLSVLASSGGYQYGLITSYSGSTRTAYMDRNWSITPDSNGNTAYTFVGYAKTNPVYMNSQLLGDKAGSNFNTFFQNSNNATVEVVDNVGSGSGITDWTATERSQIRYLLGVDGSTSIPVTAKPTITVGVTGVAQSNIISINPGITVSVTGMVSNVLNVINPVGVTGIVQSNVITVSGGLVAAPNGGFILTDLHALDGTSLSNKVGTNFNIFYQNAGNVTTELVDYVGAGGGGSGVTDWTTSERSQIRYKLGIDGSTSVPANPYAGNIELSLSGLYNIMVEKGINMNQWMEALGAVIAGSSTVNGSSINYYAMNNNGISRVQSTALSGAREVVVLLV